MMPRTSTTVLLVAMLAGCGGRYVVSVPDAVTTGGSARVVTQLRRYEVWPITFPVEQAAVVVNVADEPHRAAHTDSDGIATFMVPAPTPVGSYRIHFRHQDARGDEASATGRCYVMDPQRLTVAVDIAAVERDYEVPLHQLRSAGVQIVYVDDEVAGQTEPLRWWIVGNGLPDGPMLAWRWRRDWLGRRVEVVGSLPAAKEQLPGLLMVFWNDDDLAEAAEALDMVAFGMNELPHLTRRILSSKRLIGPRDYSGFTSRSTRDALAD